MGALPGHSKELLGEAILFFVLAFLTLIKLLSPRWRQKWGWGRGGAGGPISAIGHLGVFLAFILIACGALWRYLSLGRDPRSFYVALSGFILFVAAGLFDALSKGKSKS